MKIKGFKSTFSACEWRKWTDHTDDLLLVIIKSALALRKDCVWTQAVEEEDKMTPEQLAIKNVGKQVRFYAINVPALETGRVHQLRVRYCSVIV